MAEMENSNMILEEEQKVECNLFACPRGRRVKDFDLKVMRNIAKELRCRSFAITDRGKM